MHLLDHQFRQMSKNVVEALFLIAAPGRHVLQDGPLAGVEFDNLGHVAIDCLVIGNASTGGISDGDAACPVDIHDTRNAKRAIGVEVERVEKIIIHPAIEHINGLIPACRAHRDTPIHDPQVMPFDQLNAHLVRQKGVFVIGRVVDTGCEHRNRWRTLAGRRRRGRERTAQVARIIRHWTHLISREQLWKHPQHGFAVFQHIADTRWCARVILKHKEIIRSRAHKVDAGDMGINTPRRHHSDHLR